MKLVPLCEMTVRYSAITWVGPIGEPPGERQAWALRDGEVRGDRIRGSYQACNHPRTRADNVNLPDVHGMITSDDGASVYYHLSAYGLLDPGWETRRVVGSVTFQTGEARYRWLNSVYAVVEGRYVRGADGRLEGVFRLHECVSDE